MMHHAIVRSIVYLSSSPVGLLLAICMALPSSASEMQSPPDFSQLKSLPFSMQHAPVTAKAQQAMLRIPAGRYVIGRNDGPSIERPAHFVSVSSFMIDRTEVTNSAFAEYLNSLKLSAGTPFTAGNARTERIPKDMAGLVIEGAERGFTYPIIALDDEQSRIGYRDGSFLPTPGYGNHPVTETTWAGARAYCAWRTARLPTEAEWEVAARGADERLFPWGNQPPDETRAFVSRRAGETGAVGLRPLGASPFGVLDMSGSLAEWTSSLLRPYPFNPSDGREAQDRPGERVTRGGDYIFDAGPTKLTTTHRRGFSNAPERGHRHIGFRCATSAE